MKERMLPFSQSLKIMLIMSCGILHYKDTWSRSRGIHYNVWHHSGALDDLCFSFSFNKIKFFIHKEPTSHGRLSIVVLYGQRSKTGCSFQLELTERPLPEISEGWRGEQLNDGCHIRKKPFIESTAWYFTCSKYSTASAWCSTVRLPFSLSDPEIAVKNIMTHKAVYFSESFIVRKICNWNQSK